MTTKTAKCSTHLNQPAYGCRLCLADAKVDRDRATETRIRAEIGELEVQARFPEKWLTARVTVPALTAWLERYLDTPRGCPWPLIKGKVGVGKTSESYGLVHAAATSGRPITWQAETADQLFELLRPGGTEEPRTVMARWQAADLVLLDDLGASGQLNTWAEGRMCLLLNERYQRRLPTIITTNVPPDEFSNIFGARIASRLAEACAGAEITIKGPDRRKNPTHEGELTNG